MESVNFKSIKMNGGFWQKKQQMAQKTTVHAVYDRFYDTGRVSAFKCEKDSPVRPHVFWDSDVAKWIEGASYLISIGMGDKALEEKIDEVVDDIEKNQLPSGYFNSYFIPCEPEGIFKNRDCHELYCLGHLIEGAIAYNEATGKDKFLRLMEKYVDYVEKRFIIDKDTAFVTPGHEEIELALIKLYDHTKNEKYLDMCVAFSYVSAAKETKGSPIGARKNTTNPTKLPRSSGRLRDIACARCISTVQWLTSHCATATRN